MKKILIISPHFPPTNAADMQRIRMSLPYYKNYGWQAEIVCVDTKFSEIVKDPFLTESLPIDIKIHRIKSFSKGWTSKIGIGSLALRSMWYYWKYINVLLSTNQFDLIYFSTTQFTLCILGTYWKKRFKIPFVIDMQDPWFSNYYEDKPKNQRPPKYWFSYRLNKYLEPLAMEKVDGIISVSEPYIKTLQLRYPQTLTVPTSVITFGAFEKDFEIINNSQPLLKPAFERKEGTIHLVYVGRGGNDMQKAVQLLFLAFKKGLSIRPLLFKKLHFHFVGTSYAPNGTGRPSIQPLATEFGIGEYVEEQTDRIAFYNGLKSLLEADALIVPGSDNPEYTASKIFPYISAKKPLLAIFNSRSSIANIIQECNAGTFVDLLEPTTAINKIYSFLVELIDNPSKKNETNWDNFKQYSAENMTRKQCELFDKVITPIP